MSGPTDPARDRIVALVEAATVTGTPGFSNWDRREPLNSQAWRRFFVRATAGSMDGLSDAPNTADGGTVYLNRTYTLTCRWEALTRGGIGADSDQVLDDLERVSLSIIRGDWLFGSTGIMKLEPLSWSVVALPSGEAIEADLDITARIRRIL